MPFKIPVKRTGFFGAKFHNAPDCPPNSPFILQLNNAQEHRILYPTGRLTYYEIADGKSLDAIQKQWDYCRQELPLKMPTTGIKSNLELWLVAHIQQLFLEQDIHTPIHVDEDEPGHVAVSKSQKIYPAQSTTEAEQPETIVPEFIMDFPKLLECLKPDEVLIGSLRGFKTFFLLCLSFNFLLCCIRDSCLQVCILIAFVLNYFLFMIVCLEQPGTVCVGIYPPNSNETKFLQRSLLRNKYFGLLRNFLIEKQSARPKESAKAKEFTQQSPSQSPPKAFTRVDGVAKEKRSIEPPNMTLDDFDELSDAARSPPSPGPKMPPDQHQNTWYAIAARSVLQSKTSSHPAETESKRTSSFVHFKTPRKTVTVTSTKPVTTVVERNSAVSTAGDSLNGIYELIRVNSFSSEKKIDHITERIGLPFLNLQDAKGSPNYEGLPLWLVLNLQVFQSSTTLFGLGKRREKVLSVVLFYKINAKKFGDLGVEMKERIRSYFDNKSDFVLNLSTHVDFPNVPNTVQKQLKRFGESGSYGYTVPSLSQTLHRGSSYIEIAIDSKSFPENSRKLIASFRPFVDKIDIELVILLEPNSDNEQKDESESNKLQDERSAKKASHILTSGCRFSKFDHSATTSIDEHTLGVKQRQWIKLCLSARLRAEVGEKTVLANQLALLETMDLITAMVGAGTGQGPGPSPSSSTQGQFSSWDFNYLSQELVPNLPTSGSC